MSDPGAEVPTFNLIDEPWILCHTRNGPEALSIRQIFDGSVQTLKIVGDSPTQDYAVLRLLLAIFWRAHQRDIAAQTVARRACEAFSWPEWFRTKLEQVRTTGRDEVVLAYLNEVGDRFDLLHPEAPFMQVADLHTSSGDHSKISRIVPEAQGSFFTMRTSKGRNALCIPEAARWLVHVHSYDYAGIKSGAVGDPQVTGGKGYGSRIGWAGMTGGTVVRGETLLETLVLNSTPSTLTSPKRGGLPPWERTPDTPNRRSMTESNPSGAVDLATWQSRRIRLFFENTRVSGVLVCNGDNIPDAGKNLREDPMTPYRFSSRKSNKGSIAYYPLPYDTKRTMWRALDALVVTESDAGFTEKARAPIRPGTLSFLAELSELGIIDGVLDVNLVSMEYGNKSSTILDTTQAEIGIPLQILRSGEINEALRQDVRDAASATADAATSLGWFAGQLHVAAGGTYEFGSDAADRLYTLLEPQFITWVRQVGTVEAEQHAIAWQHTVRRNVFAIAEELVRGAGAKALIGRIDGSEDGGRLVTAGTLYQQLELKIGKNLPLTGRKATVAQPDERKAK